MTDQPTTDELLFPLLVEASNEADLDINDDDILAATPFPAQPDGITHRHGQHDWHAHAAADYATHQQPIDGEELAPAAVEPAPAA